MKKTKVHLVSTALTANSNQSHFVTNQYKDFLEEQKSINENLMNFASQISTSCQTILHDIRKQESSLHLQKRTQRNNYLYLRNLLLETIQNSKSYETHLSKQDNAIHQLQRSVNRQKFFLNNFSINQNTRYESIETQFKQYYTDKKTSIEKQHVLEQILLEQSKQQVEVKKLLDTILNLKGNINRLLSSLPPKYPIKQIIAGGVTIPLEHFLLVNEKTGIAYFSNDSKTISVDLEKIEAIYWE